MGKKLNWKVMTEALSLTQHGCDFFKTPLISKRTPQTLVQSRTVAVPDRPLLKLDLGK